jgi:hypothetical protein
MKKITFLTLVFTVALSACGAIAPAQAPEVAPTQSLATPEVVIATVLVTVVPTEGPPTPIPSVTPLPPTVPPPTEPPAQEVVQESVQEVVPVELSTSGKIFVDASMNGGVFENISLSGDRFALKCNPKEISFDLRATDVYITRVDFYYRIRDKHSTYIPSWSLGGTLQTDGGDHFWMTYTGDAVNADNRKDQGWFDVQFVGLNRYGDAVGRSGKIEGLVTYMTNCP